MDEAPRRAPRLRRQYKIQEVIKRRQVLLVQVVKEERGNKGAALTTYLSLAGRYSVLMPNTARGGGISRKITNAQDRRRLKAIAEELDVPEGMGVILRTAGASRTKAEVKRDFEYLLRMWETVRETTLVLERADARLRGRLADQARDPRPLLARRSTRSSSPAKRAIREARDFMRLLMPSHAKSVVPYRDSQPVFAKAGVEAQLDAMFSNQVTLKSGGYIVINQTEALVAIDVNSGRSTREHNIEDTALRTNLEAADEIARQLRLRDLAGLIVVDFIDMEEGAQQPRRRAADEGRAEERPRPHPGRPHLAFRPAGNVAPAHPHRRARRLDGRLPALPGRRRRALDRVGRAACAARARGRADQERDARHDGAHPHAGRALHPQPEARASARSRAPLRRRDPGRGRRHADRRQLSRARARRAGVRPEGRGTSRSAARRLWRAAGRRRGIPRRSRRPRSLEEGDATEAEPVSDEFEADTARGEGEPTTAGDDEPSRPRRRRRRRRGGERGERGERAERPSGDGFGVEAPQPTDAGLAAMAEIGGDFAVPTRAEGEAAEDEERAPSSARRRRGRRGRRGGGGDRERFGAPAPTDGVTPVESEAEPNLFDDPPREAPVEASEVAAPDAGPIAAAPAAAAAPAERADGDAQSPAPAAPPREREPVSADGPAAKTDEPATPEAEPAVEDPSRPRRSGWWQRARATLSGE